MKANELRIGNFVGLQNKGEILKVKAISEDVEGGFIVKTQTVQGISGRVGPNPLSELSPIPLTEEWLFKFKLKKLKGSFMMYIGDNELEYRINDSELAIWGADGSTEGHNFRVKIDYVHQLQNLYFALTGEELEINL